MKPFGLHWDEDPSEMTSAINQLLQDGRKVKRLSRYHLQVDKTINFYPEKETIYITGNHQKEPKGDLAALFRLLRKRDSQATQTLELDWKME